MLSPCAHTAATKQVTPRFPFTTLARPIAPVVLTCTVVSLRKRAEKWIGRTWSAAARLTLSALGLMSSMLEDMVCSEQDVQRVLRASAAISRASRPWPRLRQHPLWEVHTGRSTHPPPSSIPIHASSPYDSAGRAKTSGSSSRTHTYQLRAPKNYLSQPAVATFASPHSLGH